MTVASTSMPRGKRARTLEIRAAARAREELDMNYTHGKCEGCKHIGGVLTMAARAS